jgi:hypothetical protein
MSRKKLGTPFVGKKYQKLVARKCRICGEDDYRLLDTHRLEHGAAYSVDNVLVCCVTCHRKHHSGVIKLIGWVHSTAGRLLHWIDENGEEQFS